ncbi:MAG: hypothetical protein J6Z11_12640, partial [Candidatus Riflebacteria bacterium]|nr:hypothetical protein [Candidatus Riflebacteria bacterium]
CYVYIDENSEHIISKQGDNGYLGALVAYNYSGSVLSNGFYNRTDLNNLVGNDGTYNYCYSGIADLNSFKTDNNNPRSGSDGLDYNNSDSFNSSNSVWKKYNFTNFPPLLK